MQPEPTTLAYLAGSRHKGRVYVGAAIGIAGTRREPHDLAAALFGGTVRSYAPREPAQCKCCADPCVCTCHAEVGTDG